MDKGWYAGTVEAENMTDPAPQPVQQQIQRPRQRQRQTTRRQQAMRAAQAMTDEREEYDRDRWQSVTTRLDNLTEAQNRTNLAIQRIESAVMPHKDIQDLVNTRLSKETWEGEKTLIWAAITQLRNGPAGVRAWLSVIIAGSGCLVAPIVGALTSGVVTLIIWLITTKP